MDKSQQKHRPPRIHLNSMGRFLFCNKKRYSIPNDLTDKLLIKWMAKRFNKEGVEKQDIENYVETVQSDLDAERSKQDSKKGNGVKKITDTNTDNKSLESRQVMKGLFNDQIDNIMKKYKSFLGTISRDEVDTKIIPQLKEGMKGCYIQNLDPSYKSGSHWCAIFFDPVDSKSIEWYDSFARACPDDIRQQLKQIAKIIAPHEYLKLKINHIVDQRSNSESCGYLCIIFLKRRLSGQDFSKATHYSSINDAEKKALQLKQQVGYGFI